MKISVRGSLKCWSEIQFDKKKILYHAARVYLKTGDVTGSEEFSR